MAILVMEGFDGYGSASDFRTATEDAVLYNISLIGFDATGGRFSGGALDLDGSASSEYVVHFTPPALTTKIYVGFWYKGVHAGGSASYSSFFGFYSEISARLVRFDVNPNGNIRSQSQASVNTDSAAGVLTNGVYHWVEIEFLPNTTAANGTLEVRVDGVAVITATGQDYNTGNLCSHLRFFGSTTHDILIDDLVIWTDQGAAPTSWIGESRISTYLPTANGAVQDWTPSAGNAWQAIDDPLNAVTDDDTTYIEADGAGEKARFAMDDIPDTTTTIHAVAVKARVRKTGYATKTMRGYIRSNGTESNGTTIGLVAGYKLRTLGIFPLNPDGNVAWLDAAVNAMEAGVEVIS